MSDLSDECALALEPSLAGIFVQAVLTKLISHSLHSLPLTYPCSPLNACCKEFHCHVKRPQVLLLLSTKQNSGFLAPLVSLALAFVLALLCPPAACVPCVSSSFESESCCFQAQCHPALCPTSPQDPPLPPRPSLPQLPTGSFESLVHNSTHPPLDSWPGPGWTSSLPPDCLSSLTFSLVAFYRNIHQISYFKKIASKIYPQTYTVCAVKFQKLLYPH